MESTQVLECVRNLSDPDPALRVGAAYALTRLAALRVAASLEAWVRVAEFRGLLVTEERTHAQHDEQPAFKMTTGIAVFPPTFQNIRTANGNPPLAQVPPDQDALEFELEFENDALPPARLDILTTRAPGERGAIARYLEKFGEGIQQVELDVTHVDRATEILRSHFQQAPIYPATRPGANCTRVNFFLASDASQKKVLVELVEKPIPNDGPR